ncbi:C-type lectin domain family 2 member B-like [Chelonoidis abingdonii]|uniref:C-type lectin domain-containing protein n=1 Tax=Chelonoidis abingdonii TaxID=106734 RepID=A0A8C0J2J7_CHEAB|nr:C-type lectin domain family 2 member D-like [Chelonoidis abingdonii]
MGSAAGAAESEEPLQQVPCIDCSGHQNAGREPESHRYYKKCRIVLAVTVAVVFLGLIIAVVLAVLYGCSSAALGPACPDGWVGYQRKCYYFSEAEGNWNHSQRHCSSLCASLAAIDSGQEMDFMLRYKGKFDHWIGLRRYWGQPWKWANGTKFNNLFPIGGGGDCVYLNDLGGASSLRCTSERHWICTKPSVSTEAKEAAAEGDWAEHC